MNKLDFYSPYIIFALALGVIFFFISFFPIFRIGDGAEYYALFYAWSDLHRPWMTDYAYDGYEAFLQSKNVINEVPTEILSESFPALRVAQTADFNHFWVYSLLAYLASVPFMAFGADLDAHDSFLMLHYLILLATISVFYYTFKWQGVLVAVIFVFTSPLVWYLNKVHTELFTVALALMSFALLQNKKYLSASFLLGLASTQNISFAVVAALPFFYRLFMLRGKQFSITELMLAIGTSIIVLAHPAYYVSRYDVFSPQFLAGGASLAKNLGNFYIWLLDPDVGLIAYWPFGLVIIVLSIIFLITLGRKISRQEDYFLVFFVLFYLVINFYAHSSTENLNSGGTRGPARYALWYLPVFLPLLLYVLRFVTRQKLSVYLFGLSVGISGVNNYYLHNPALGEQYDTPSWLSYYIQKNFSYIYSPPAEIFAERYSGLGEAVNGLRPRAILGPDCEKLLVFNGEERETVFAPSNCNKDLAVLKEISSVIAFEQSNELESFYYNLTKEEQSKSNMRLRPGFYTVGATGNGNFILGSGWSVLENWGVWSTGSEVSLRLPCNSHQFYHGYNKIYLNLHFSPFGEQTINVKYMGVLIYDGEVKAEKEVQLEIDPYNCNSTTIDIVIFISEPKSPMEMGLSSDARELGVGLTKFELR